MDMHNSPYFGSVGSGSRGLAMDQAFESWLESQGLPKQYQAPRALTAEQQIDAQKRGIAKSAIAARPIQQTGYASINERPAAPQMSTTPTLLDAQAALKSGNQASAENMMRAIVGLPPL
jgi:hypothetical protein